MALPTDRNSLIAWCLRKLGEPTTHVNLDEEQIEDRVDEALEMFREYHMDGTALFCKGMRVTGSSLKLVAPPSGTIPLRQLVTGQTSGAEGRYEYMANETELVFIYTDRNDPTPFQDGEAIITTDGITAQLIAENAVTLGNMDKKYFDIDDSVIGITEFLVPRSSFGSHPINPFDLQYQLAQNVTIQTFLNADVITYYMFQQDIQLWNQLFVGVYPYFHARKQGRLYLEVNWPEKFRIGQYVVIKYWGAIDPTEHPKVYSDKWLRKYLAALLKEQWGTNLTKYNEVVLPGGIRLNGQQILEIGTQEKLAALEELRTTYEQPVPFKIG
jgi:hypothetical protein